jgi:hypothetical protein
VPLAGWSGVSNGKLLARISGNYDVFITVDKNLPAQQTPPPLLSVSSQFAPAPTNSPICDPWCRKFSPCWPPSSQAKS